MRVRLHLGVLALLAVGRAAPPPAGSIVVVTSAQTQAYGVVLDGLRSGLGPASAAWTVVDLATGGEAALAEALARPSTRLVIAVGSQAIAVAGSRHAGVPLVATMILRSDAGSAAASVSLDVPIEDLLGELKRLFPGKTRRSEERRVGKECRL